MSKGADKNSTKKTERNPSRARIRYFGNSFYPQAFYVYQSLLLGNRGIEKDTDNVEERQNFTQASLSSKIPLELELTDNESEDGRTTHEDSGSE